LTLLHFNAKKIESSQVLLDWKTTNEIETDYFEVERSINQSNTFSSVSKVPANSGSTVFSYSFLDKMIVESGIYYYRLKMMDKDGSYGYSEIRKVDIDAKPSSIFVYPVPVASAGKLQIVWPGTNGFQHYKLVSMDGKVVMQSRLAFNAGIASLLLHTNIKSGTYLLQFFAANQPYQIQILVQ